MGSSVSIVKSSDEEKKKKTRGEMRRKNSFSSNMARYIKNVDNDYTELYRQCKAERDAILLKIQRNNRDASKFEFLYQFILNCLLITKWYDIN
jgi:hypothetical protein